VADDVEPGRPAVEAVFVAMVATAIVGVALVHVLAAVLPPQADAGTRPPALPLTLAVLSVSFSFAIAQAALPGPRSSGWFGLAIPLAAGIALASRGLSPSAVVSPVFIGVFLTPAAYYIAIRLSFPLAGLARHRPLTALLAAAVLLALLYQAARWITFAADKAAGFPAGN
jgi:hypothetical protein